MPELLGMLVHGMGLMLVVGRVVGCERCLLAGPPASSFFWEFGFLVEEFL